MQPHGFIDLRMDADASAGEGFWPAFTDIMTVIVLIFIMSMLTLLVKNMGLVDQLTATLELERSALLQAESTGDVNAQLIKDLKELRQKLTHSTGEVTELSLKVEQIMSQLSESQKDNVRLSSELNLANKLNQDKLNKESALKKAFAALKAGRIKLAKMQFALDESQSTLKRKQHIWANKKAILLAKTQQLKRAMNRQKQQYAASVKEIEDLKKKNVFCFQVGH